MDERKADGKGELGDPQVGLDLPPAVLPAHLPPVKMRVYVTVIYSRRPRAINSLS